MNKTEEKHFLRRFRKMVIDTHKLTKEARAMRKDLEEYKRKRLKKVI
jgi:predicted ATP-grasp superfamily ATP-dependent carboligase